MTTFLIDNDRLNTYDELLEDINNAVIYYPNFRCPDLYNYFLNIIVALVNSKPLELIDADLSDSELIDIGVKTINVSVPIECIKSLNFKEVLDQIKKSESKISIFTSGTTGQPKKIIHTVNSLTKTVRISENHLNHIWGFAYNPTHMAGLQVFFQAIMNMNILVNLFNQSRNQIYEAIHKYSITHISATPTFYRLLTPIEKEYSTVRRITFGGEKSDKKLYENVLSIFPNASITNIYASTEAGSLFFSNGENFQIPSNIINKIRVKEDEILIHKSLMGLSENFIFDDDYYATGDLIEWIEKEKGIFRFKSRKNEMINIGGYKVNPTEIESQLLQMNGVLQVIVFSKPNSVLGNILCADIIIEKASKLTEYEIRTYLSSVLQDFKIPRKISFVESILLTRTGKMKRL